VRQPHKMTANGASERRVMLTALTPQPTPNALIALVCLVLAAVQFSRTKAHGSSDFVNYVRVV